MNPSSSSLYNKRGERTLAGFSPSLVMTSKKRFLGFTFTINKVEAQFIEDSMY